MSHVFPFEKTREYRVCHDWAVVEGMKMRKVSFSLKDKMRKEANESDR
jgi:predicted GNAT superfamily acetyltransferase